MKTILKAAGSFAGIAGIILCAIAGFTRVSGSYYLAGYEASTFFIGGIALLTMACYLKLEGRDL